MSRLTSMSADAIKAVFSPEMDSDLIFLLTIYDPDYDPQNPNDPEHPDPVAARLADNFTQRLTQAPYAETATEVYYGVVSNSQQFVFLPMELTLPSEEEAQAPRCSLTLRDVSGFVVPIIRGISGPPKVKMELVLSKTPDRVEASFIGFYINSFTYNADSVTAELSMIDYEREPFPMHSFTAPYFPGLF
jgi:hypothetical protein